jgi:hypothetical protein
MNITSIAPEYWFRTVLASLVALSLFGTAAAADTSHGEFAVWAIGLPGGYVVMEHQMPVVRVTPDDVQRGMVDVQAATRIVITSTEPSGVVVDFRHLAKLFQAVRIGGIGPGFELGPAGETIVESEATAGRRVLAVDYHFMLAPAIQPGTYAWPFAMTMRPSPSPRWRERAALPLQGSETAAIRGQRSRSFVEEGSP